MSGDVQPRKRKDKKKRKDDVDQIPEKSHVSVFSNNTSNNEDVNIHVHKDEGTGGGICAKLVFFILFSALAVLIGLIITEHRGLTDLETIDPNSKFSQIFEGWVDSNSHDEHDEHDLNAIDDLDDDHHESDSDHADEDDDNDHLDENDNDDLDDNDEKSIEFEHSEEEDDEDDDDELEPIEDDDEDADEEPEDGDADDDNINEIDDEDEDDNDEDDNDEDNDTVEESKESGEVAASEEDDIEQDEEEEDDENDKDDKQKDTEDYDDDNDKEVDGDQDITEQDDKDEESDNAEVSNEKRDNSDEQLDNEDDVDNSKEDDEDDDQGIGDDDQEDKQEEDITTNKVSDEKDKDDAHKDTLSNKKEVIKEGKKQPESKSKETITKDAEKAEDDDLGSSGMAVKLGVGVALLVVAHLVLVKKWRNADDDTLPSTEKLPPTVQDRRNTIIVPPTFKEVEPDMEQGVEDFADEGEEDEGEENAEEKSESNSAKAKYQELATAYTRPVLESKYNTEHTHGDYEYEDEEEEQYQEEVEDEDEDDDEEEEESEEEEGEGEEYDDEEVEDVDDEDEELLKRLEARYGKLQKDNDSNPTENRDSDKHEEYTNIASSEDDYRIRKQIDEAQSSVKNNSAHAIVLFDKLLQKFPSSPRSLYGKAMALDILADQKRSNELLEKSLQIYVQVLQTENVPTALYQLAAQRCINRMRFIGQYKNAIAVHKLIIKRFPDNPQHLNSLIVTYLTINRIEDARTLLKQILTKWPEDGFALVHYGFILKTTDNKLEESVRYLKKGISTKDEGVIDGRFYFHLGDALVRLGRRDEADKIYEEGRRNKVFLSKYQRSLYNVPRLSAKPWWSFNDLPSYLKSLSLLAASWKEIRNEGLTILNEKGYFQDESENLRHTGEWKQFELFARGQKNVKNCKICPITCNIINQISEANTCKRGQTKFSVMHPRTHIWPHCGPTNCRLRAHLGLKIPKNTFIRVADDTKSWKEGEVLIFDDSFEHEVWHNGTDFRLILIVDIWHPELTPAERNSLSPI